MLYITKDGSCTLYSEQFNEHYHSIHGAVQEANHVFINAGLNYFENKTKLTIFEMGFGTGLNALLSLLKKSPKQEIIYHSIELYPLQKEAFKDLNYGSDLKQQQLYIQQFHESPWDQDLSLAADFKLRKINADIKQYIFETKYDLIYFDAFSPSHQDELWTEDIFKKIKEFTYRWCCGIRW